MQMELKRSESLIFAVEGGRALEMVKEHIADRLRVKAETDAMLKELGVDEFSAKKSDGKLISVVFNGPVHAEFCKPNGRHALSCPRKGSSWDKRLKYQKGYRVLSFWIAEEFQIPMQINYKGKETLTGSRCIGNMFNECGFLYLGEDGPYAMWIPDVPTEVAKTIAEGYEVEEPANSFVPVFDGCRRIEKEEWEILVLQNKLAKKKAQ
jgi:hypothetical protein